VLVSAIRSSQRRDEADPLIEQSEAIMIRYSPIGS
jgi:hypothetical protein